jgi:TP901-1 family phage major tail protein
MNGVDILLGIDDGTEIQIVGSQRNATFTETTAEIDVSSKDSRATRVLPGRYKATVSGEALYVPTDPAYQMLQTAMRDGEDIIVIREEEGVYLESAVAIITSLGTAAPDQDGVVVSFDLTVDGWFVSGT